MLTAGLIIAGALYLGALVGYRKAYLRRREEIENEF